jgi:hypothetical protein
VVWLILPVTLKAEIGFPNDKEHLAIAYSQSLTYSNQSIGLDGSSKSRNLDFLAVGRSKLRQNVQVDTKYNYVVSLSVHKINS